MRAAFSLRLMSLGLLLLEATLAHAKPLKIRALDESGAAFPNVLIIVRSLENSVEVGRYLTNAGGETPELSLAAGPVQIIATCPYGICKTLVRDYSVASLPDILLLKIPVLGTDQNGELVGARKLSIVLDPAVAGKQAGQSVTLLVRDGEAKRQRWYRPGTTGELVIELLGERTWVTVFSKGEVARYVLSRQCGSSPLNDDREASCVQIDGGEVHLKLPKNP